MTQRTFTDAYIRGLKALRKPYKRAEQAPKGEGRLIVRVLPNSVKEFFYRYRVNGDDKTLSLGRYDPRGHNGKTLAEIREAAATTRKIQRDTGDVKAHLRAEDRRNELETRKGSLRQLLSAYVESLRAAGKPSADQVEGIFRRNILEPFPFLADSKANEIEPGDIQRVLARMVRAGIKRQVNITRAYLRAAFAYGGEADHDPRTIAGDGVLFGLKGNPVTLVPTIEEYEKVGNRTLSEDELREYWNALDPLPDVQRATLRFNVALGCQRISQLLRVDWSVFDFEEKTLLLRDSKGRGGARDHLLPLTDFALEQLKRLRELNGTAREDGTVPPPFSSDGKRRIVLTTLSVAVHEVSKRLKKEKKIPAFQLRDLRRTCETMLQKLGIDKEVRAHLLSHGRTTGVQGRHYERYNFLREKRKALERWAHRVQQILEPTKTRKVITLPGSSRRR